MTIDGTAIATASFGTVMLVTTFVVTATSKDLVPLFGVRILAGVTIWVPIVFVVGYIPWVKPVVEFGYLLFFSII